MKRVFALLITLALIVGMVGCPAARVEVELDVSSTSGGTVTEPGEGAFTYQAGKVVELVAVPDECYRFVNWTGDTVANPESATTTITMDAAKGVTANFAQARYDLVVGGTDGGSVINPGEGTFSYDCATVATLVAEPREGHRFVNWTGDVGTIADPNTATTTITMNDDYEIRANFVAQYVLTIGSTHGGEVIMPGEGAFTYDADTVVPLVAEAEDGYRFVKWMGDVSTVVYSTSAFATIAMNDDYSVTAEFEELDPQKLFAGGSGTEGNPYRIADWYHLNNVQYFLGAHYKLMNDLDSTTPGYAELASTTANHGKGWQPIGSLYVDPFFWGIVAPVTPFAGSFDGRGHEIRDLFINRPDENLVGLFADVDEGGVIQHIALVSVQVIGHDCVGSLVGVHYGTANDSHSEARVTGSRRAGGLMGLNYGTVRNSSAKGSVSGESEAGGLVGQNCGTVSDCHSANRVVGSNTVGGLVALNCPTASVSNSYATGPITGLYGVGGLVGRNDWTGTVRNSHYNYEEVLINAKNTVTIGALSNDDFKEWLANGRFLDVNARLSQEDGYYAIENLGDFKQLLAFGQDDSLRFRLKNDLDLAYEPDFFIPYLAGEFHGNGHRVANLTFESDAVSQVGLFGYLATSAEVSDLGVENVSVAGCESVGGLVGWNSGTLTNSYATGSVAGRHIVGGVVGNNIHTVGNSYFSGSVTGQQCVGGLVGLQEAGVVYNSHYNYADVLVNGQQVITIGALFDEEFSEWLANGRFLDVNTRLLQKHGYYLINDVSDFRQLLAFGQDDSLRFRLGNDLDLVSTPNFYIPYLAGEFDGNGHAIANLRLNLGFAWQVGLFGFVANSGKVTQIDVESVDVAGDGGVGGVVGWNEGTVSKVYVTGIVSGTGDVGGLVGFNRGTITGSYSNGRVTSQGGVGGLVGRNWWGTVNDSHSSCDVIGNGHAVGGLVGWNNDAVHNAYCSGSVSGDRWVGGLVGLNTGSVGNAYSTGRVVGNHSVGGLVGRAEGGSVHNSFWDTETSSQATSDGGTGKTTAQMKDIATFRTAGWSIVEVAGGETDLSRTWNIVDGQSYPFLSWQSVS